MEKILALYELSYDVNYPVVCYDERPCFLIGDRIQILDMKPGQVKKEHYAYEKKGSCSVLASIEPLTGRRYAHVRKRRTKKEFAIFLKGLAEQYPEAKKIRLVMDNLNTHNASSLYESFSAAEAFKIMERFEFYYTPKSASWLNMIEIEFSALSRLCLNRRIPNINMLSTEVFAFLQDRMDKGVKITWQFTKNDAREKLKKHYITVNEKNKI